MDLEEFASSVTGYISKCVDDMTTTRTTTTHPNQKPWLNGEVRSLLRAQDFAFRSEEASANPAVGIKRAKAEYALKIRVTSPPMILGACGRVPNHH